MNACHALDTSNVELPLTSTTGKRNLFRPKFQYFWVDKNKFRSNFSNARGNNYPVCITSKKCTLWDETQKGLRKEIKTWNLLFQNDHFLFSGQTEPMDQTGNCCCSYQIWHQLHCTFPKPGLIHKQTNILSLNSSYYSFIVSSLDWLFWFVFRLELWFISTQMAQCCWLMEGLKWDKDFTPRWFR